MNYQMHYDRLIERAQNRCIPINQYKEMHHILPKSMGGSNEKINLVALFPEEHLVAHLLLYKIHRNKEMIFACHRMTNHGNINNKQYKWVREKHAVAVSEQFKGRVPWNKGKFGVQESAMFGKNHSVGSKAKISSTKMGVKHKTEFCINCQTEIGINNFIRYHGESCKSKPGNEQIHTKPISDEIRKKISDGVKNTVRVLSVFECPHCGKTGKGPNMTRWHFDNCKFKDV